MLRSNNAGNRQPESLSSKSRPLGTLDTAAANRWVVRGPLVGCEVSKVGNRCASMHSCRRDHFAFHIIHFQGLAQSAALPKTDGRPMGYLWGACGIAHLGPLGPRSSLSRASLGQLQPGLQMQPDALQRDHLVAGPDWLSVAVLGCCIPMISEVHFTH